MPMFSKSGDDTLLDWTAARTTNGYAHLVMAPQTIQLILQKNNSQNLISNRINCIFTSSFDV